MCVHCVKRFFLVFYATANEWFVFYEWSEVVKLLLDEFGLHQRILWRVLGVSICWLTAVEGSRRHFVLALSVRTRKIQGKFVFEFLRFTSEFSINKFCSHPEVTHRSIRTSRSDVLYICMQIFAVHSHGGGSSLHTFSTDKGWFFVIDPQTEFNCHPSISLPRSRYDYPGSLLVKFLYPLASLTRLLPVSNACLLRRFANVVSQHSVRI